MKLRSDHKWAVAALRIVIFSSGVLSRPCTRVRVPTAAFRARHRALRAMPFIFRYDLGVHRDLLAETDPGPCSSLCDVHLDESDAHARVA